jgi:hypothetical protein
MTIDRRRLVLGSLAAPAVAADQGPQRREGLL